MLLKRSELSAGGSFWDRNPLLYFSFYIKKLLTVHFSRTWRQLPPLLRSTPGCFLFFFLHTPLLPLVGSVCSERKP